MTKAITSHVHTQVVQVPGATDAERSKPDPDIYAAAHKQVGPKVANAIVVGDSPHIIRAAAKLGLRTTAVRSCGFDDLVPTDAGAIAIYDDPADLIVSYDASTLAS